MAPPHPHIEALPLLLQSLFYSFLAVLLLVALSIAAYSYPSSIPVMSGVVLVAALASFLINIVRSKSAPHKISGQRWAWRSLGVAGVAFLAFSVASNYEDEEKARQLGFASSQEMRAAARYGIIDPDRWAPKRAELDAEQAKRAAARAQQEAEARAAQAKIDAKKAEADDQKAREEARFNCLSRWDGSMAKFVEAVKGKLRDPESFEHLSTFISAVKPNGWQYVTMQFRARNGFGGMNVQRAKATVDNKDCSVLGWEML